MWDPDLEGNELTWWPLDDTGDGEGGGDMDDVHEEELELALSFLDKIKTFVSKKLSSLLQTEEEEEEEGSRSSSTSQLDFPFIPPSSPYSQYRQGSGRRGKKKKRRVRSSSSSSSSSSSPSLSRYAHAPSALHTIEEGHRKRGSRGENEEEEEEEDYYFPSSSSSSFDDEEEESNSSFSHRLEEEEEGNSWKSSSMKDGLLDVVAVVGTFHLGQTQVGLAQPIKLCQCSQVDVRLTSPYPIQADGEPWDEAACTFTIRSMASRKGVMLKRMQETKHVVGEVHALLEWAERTDVISSSQKESLLLEFSQRLERAEDEELSRSSESSESYMIGLD